MKTNKVKSVIVTVVLIVILLAAVGGIVVLLRNFGGESILGTTEEFTVRYDQQVISEKSVISLAPGHPMTFEVSSQDYDVKIVPNTSAENINFVIDGENVSLRSVKDYTKAFTINKQDEKFIISCAADFTTFASAIWANKSVMLAEDTDLSEESYFLMQVSSGEKTYSFPLRLMLSGAYSDITNVIGIVLDATEVCL